MDIIPGIVGKPYGIICAGSIYTGNKQQFCPCISKKNNDQKQTVYYQKACGRSNGRNVSVLQFLDCLKDIEKSTEIELETCGRILTEYARRNGITKKRIDQFIAKYPVKIYKAIYETGVEYVSS